MKVVGIGGGTGLPVLLGGLKRLNDLGLGPIDITAVVTVSDSGGSTGVLRRAFDIPALGDIRNCLLSLSRGSSILASVCRHRFDKPECLNGHSVGNLVLAALCEVSGGFGQALRDAAALLQIDGRVLPSTERPVTLCALYEDGSLTEGEAEIPKTHAAISRIWLSPDDPEPAAGVLDAITDADVIVIGPGSLYTSIIPNLLVAGVAEAIHESQAMTCYVTNLMTQPGETGGFSAADHLRTLSEYLPSARDIDVCILNSTGIGTAVAERYLQSGSVIVTDTPKTEDEIRSLGVTPVAAPLLKAGEMKARHDSTALARLVVSLARGFAAAPETICGGQRLYET